MEEKRVGLYGDAANLYGDARDGNVKLDYAAPLQHARRLGKLVHANLYAVRCNGDKDKGFLVAMKNIGFTKVVARHPRIRPDGQIKSDLDTALTMDVTQAALAGEVDVVVILSGDSDFTYLVERLVERGIEVHVIGPDRSTAWEMIVAANYFAYASQVPGFVQPVSRELPEALPVTLPVAQRPG
jgi:uncharacterized LabA/DUF88 family protein